MVRLESSNLMEKNDYYNDLSSWEGTTPLAAELLAGRDLAKQLQLLDQYDHPPPSRIPSCSSSESVVTTSSDDHPCHEEEKSQQQQYSTSRQGVITQKILESYDNALSLLSQYHLKSGTGKDSSSSLVSQNGAASPSCKIPPSYVQRGSYKRRILKSTRHVEVTLEDCFNDGFSWRKYGQKEILGAKYPRSYFRCAYKHDHGCQATKQTQQNSNENPALYQVTYIGTHTCPGMQEASSTVTWSPSPASSTATKSPVFDLNQKPQQSGPAAASRVPPFPGSYTSASDLKTWEVKDDAMFKLDSDFSGCEELQLNPELHFSDFWFPEFDTYGMNVNVNDGMSDTETDLDLDLDLGLGTGMSPGMPTNVKASSGVRSSLDLQIGMSSVPDCGMTLSLQSELVSCFLLEEDKKKVSDRMLDMAESIHMKVKDYAALSEFKPSHCNSMMNTEEKLYISKSPSLRFCCAHNFVSLFFPYLKLPELWKGGKQLLVSLKRLDAKHSDLLWIPDLSKAQKLESLNLEGCADLVGISSIQYLTKLQHLNLKGCQSLKGIPSLIRLKLLKTFDLSDCSNLTRLPPSLGCLPNLSELNLKNCAKLANLPRSVMHLMKSLEILNISGCSSMWQSIGENEDGAVPFSTKQHYGFSVMPSSGATHQENLPNSNTDIPAKQVELFAEGSSSQDKSVDLKDIRGKKAKESEEEALIGTPLISSLLSELRTALLFLPNVGSSHASSSSSQDTNIQAIHHTENNNSETKESEIAAVLQMEDHYQQQKLCSDDDHYDAKTDQKNPLSAAAEPIFCQVEDCQVDLTGADTYHQQLKICEVHCKATAALLGNILQRFCQQCCRFHVLGDFDEEERNCKIRLAGYHQKQRRQSSAPTTTSSKDEHSSSKTEFDAENTIAESEDENEKCLLHKRIRTIDPSEQNQPAQATDWDEADAIGDIEDHILEMIEQISRSNYGDDGDKAAAVVPEGVVAWLAEMEQSVPETVRSMKLAKAKAAVDSEKWKAADSSLVIGELQLRLLDMELTRISEEEEEIEAELQRLMDKKRQISQEYQ